MVEIKEWALIISCDDGHKEDITNKIPKELVEDIEEFLDSIEDQEEEDEDEEEFEY